MKGVRMVRNNECNEELFALEDDVELEAEDDELVEEKCERKKRGILFSIFVFVVYTFVLYMFSVYTNVNRPFLYLGGAVLAIACVTAAFIGRINSRPVRVIYTLMFMLVQFGALIQLILNVEPLGYEPEGVGYFLHLTTGERSLVISMAATYAVALILSLISVLVFRAFRQARAPMKLALLLTFFSAVAYILTIVFGTSIGGTRVSVTAFGFAFQPGEILKYVYCIIIGLILGGDYADIKKRVRYASGITLMVLAFMVLQGEFGTLQVVALSYGVIIICYLGVKGIVKLCAFVAALGLGGAIIYYANHFVLKIPFLTIQFNKIFYRFRVWLNPDYDINGAGYQMHQAMQKIYQAGWFGQYGSKNTIYAAENDLVIVSIIYAFGLITALALVVVFVAMAINQLRVISQAKSSRLKIMAAVASTLLFSQVFFNIGGATGVIPLSGITLPLISKGGSSIVSVSLMMTLVLMLASRKEGEIDEEISGSEDTTGSDGYGDSAGNGADTGDCV